MRNKLLLEYERSEKPTPLCKEVEGFYILFNKMYETHLYQTWFNPESAYHTLKAKLALIASPPLYHPSNTPMLCQAHNMVEHTFPLIQHPHMGPVRGFSPVRSDPVWFYFSKN